MVDSAKIFKSPAAMQAHVSRRAARGKEYKSLFLSSGEWNAKKAD
jgi:hypothetical protein